MKKPTDRLLAPNAAWDAIRLTADEYGNHALDEFLAGRITRRELLRYASVMGLSLAGAGLLGAPRAHAQGASSTAAASNQTIRVAHLTPAGAVDPLTVTDAASLALLNQTGEFLVDDDGEKLQLKPALALSWKPNDKGDVWTFKLRQNVQFHDGQRFGAKDVVATFDRLSDPASGSAALSVLKGVLSKGGAKLVDEYTVAFHLDAPNGNFPYYVSSDNYKRTERQLSVLRFLGQLQRGDLARQLRGKLRKKLYRHRPVQAGEISAEGRRVVRAQSGLLGRKSVAAARTVQFLRGRTGAIARAPRSSGRRNGHLHRAGRRRYPE
jgi:hypothetical protein